MRRSWILSLGLATLFAGCSKDEPAPNQASSGPSAEPVSAGGPAAAMKEALQTPGAYIEAAVGARDYAKREIWLTELRQRVQVFEALNGRRPNDLQELAKESPLRELPSYWEFHYDPRTGSVDIVDKPLK